MKQNKVVPVIGLTGGIGCGKSFVVEQLSFLCRVSLILTDEIARGQMKKNEKSYQAVVKEFGNEILTADGEINRAKLASIVFNDKEALRKLNELTHPAVKEAVSKIIRESKGRHDIDLILVESALPTEAEFEKICDEIWYCHAPISLRKKRLRESRGYTNKRISDVMDRQPKEQEYRQKCTHIINNGPNINREMLAFNLKEQLKRLQIGGTYDD